jgi:diaminohydroxyphosphoribosylaminopyrimidine deaminase/5-amino-6-(5-phosphoribosylamino)uracil reductase
VEKRREDARGKRLLSLWKDEAAASTDQPGGHWVVENLFRIRELKTPALSRETQDLLSHYLPYCFLARHAHQLQRAVTVSHFAQSLDGRIATATGDSKWIGNNDNLIHAHRMRALCDGILIGKGTLESDQPSLTVRHVPGENPQRIVLGSKADDYSSLLNSCEKPIWVIGSKEDSSHPQIKFFCLSPSDNGCKPSCQEVLEFLYRQGIYSVYVEGGAFTTSRFLHQGMIDVMQLHYSPQVFGSGLLALQLPQIESVPEAVSFQSYAFLPVGDSMMFVGEPQR